MDQPSRPSGSNKAVRTALTVVIAVVLVADFAVFAGRSGDPQGAAPEPTAEASPTASATVKPSPTPSKPPTIAPTKKPVVSRTTAPPRRRSLGCGGHADFNGDRRSDLAIGIPKQDVNGLRDAGAVQVIYGGSGGLVAGGNQVWSEDSPGLPTKAQRDAQFGGMVAFGDFNGDGFSDLAIGAPLKDLGASDEGSVLVLYGSRAGLTAKRSSYWTQNTAGVEEESQLGDQFGQSLATGDFNGDGFADLAIGAPKEDLQRPGFLQATGSAGAVNVLFGSANGLTAKGNQLVTQNMLGLDDVADGNDLFAWSLTSGDFNGDGICDIASGVPGQRVQGKTAAGAVSIVLGSGSGFGPKGAQFWTESASGVSQSADDHQFGFHLTSGDFNGDKRSDLAIGIPFKAIGSANQAGAIAVLYGSKSALTKSGAQLWAEGQKGLGGDAEGGDQVGLSLTAGSFDGNAFDDLAFGVPFQRFGEGAGQIQAAGSVGVIYGSSRGLTATGNQVWTKSNSGGGSGANSDLFGQSLAAGDFNRDGRVDLAVGIPGETTSRPRAGAVQMILGSPSKLNATGARQFQQGVDGIGGSAQQDGAFGSKLAS